MEENTLSVLKIAPGQHPQQVEIDNDLKALQQAVGGSIDAVYPFADPVAIICNDEGKVAFNLTKRQLLCFGTAALIGVPLFFVLRDSGGNTAATLGMMAVMLPAFFLGMYEKNGQPMEKLLSYYVQSRFVRPKIRPYKTNNYYALLMKGGMTHDPILEKDR